MYFRKCAAKPQVEQASVIDAEHARREVFECARWMQLRQVVHDVVGRRRYIVFVVVHHHPTLIDVTPMLALIRIRVRAKMPYVLPAPWLSPESGRGVVSRKHINSVVRVIVGLA